MYAFALSFVCYPMDSLIVQCLDEKEKQKLKAKKKKKTEKSCNNWRNLFVSSLDNNLSAKHDFTCIGLQD